MSVVAVVTAAGSGTRLGASVPKALVELAGEPLIVHAVRGMVAGGVRQIVVTIPEGYEEDFARALAQFSPGSSDDSKVDGTEIGTDPVRVTCVVGGRTRQESVARGLAEVDAPVVLIHDAARCLTPPSVIARVVEAVQAGAEAVVPVMAVTDTIKRAVVVADDNTPLYAQPLGETVDRAELRAVQTPQGFVTELVKRAHVEGEKLSVSELSAAPDDAALVELLGKRVWAVSGSSEALKITTPFDLAVAEFLCQRRKKDNDV
ncbi:2-C-methyl-D-erythritol 4-phosphate cytidylyltransferase [Arcanobacterium canis]